MTVHLAAPAIPQFFNNVGQLNAGGSILTQVGGVNAATYQDSGGLTPLPNPIPLNSRGEISDAAGNSRQLFLTDGSVYTFTLYDAASNQLDTFTYMVGISTSADISTLQSQITAFATSITTAALTVTGGTTLSTLSVGAITGTGAVNIGTNTLTCGAITATGETLSGNLAMGGNSITGALNITATGAITAASFSTTTPNAASFMSNAATTSGNVVNLNTNGTSSGSGISCTAGTITFANVGTYDVTFSGIFKNPTAATNINTTLFFGGTANTIVGPVTGNPQGMEIAGANGAVYTGVTMRAIVITSAINQTLTVNSTLSFGGTYQADANCYAVIAQK